MHPWRTPFDFDASSHIISIENFYSLLPVEIGGGSDFVKRDSDIFLDFKDFFCASLYQMLSCNL